jgi:hypothetical protein
MGTGDEGDNPGQLKHDAGELFRCLEEQKDRRIWIKTGESYELRPLIEILGLGETGQSSSSD